jgi:glycerophosphoryl diester phosphodiesterase
MEMLNQVVYSSFGHHLRSELAKVYEKLKIETPFCFGYLCWRFEELLTISYESEHDCINIDYGLYQKDKGKVIDAINKAKAKNIKVKFYIPRPYQENLDDFKIFKELGVDTVITDFPIEALELAKQVEA